MLFILWKAQRGREREMRGIQRLLCTLLCTRSKPHTNPVPPTAPTDVTPTFVASADIVRPPSAERLGFGEFAALTGPSSFWRR
jgi:hypothetical protein